MTNDFHLLDLVSQANAVQERLRGLAIDEKVSWLARHGKVTPYQPAHPDLKPVWYFESRIGIECIFFFDLDQLVFVGDHTTYTVPPADDGTL